VARIAQVNGRNRPKSSRKSRGCAARFQQVNEGMRNQSTRGAAKFNEAMMQIAQGTQQTQVALEEFNRATGHLRAAVEMLNKEIAQFTV